MLKFSNHNKQSQNLNIHSNGFSEHWEAKPAKPQA